MDSLVHADIFFFITTIAVIIGAILVAIALIYGILILRDLLDVSHRVKKEAELISMDIQEAREHIKKHASGFGAILGFLKGIFGSGKKTKK